MDIIHHGAMAVNKKRKSPSLSARVSSSRVTRRRSTRAGTLSEAKPGGDDDDKIRIEESLEATSTTSNKSLGKKAATQERSYNMRMILSPAKTLNLNRDADDLPVQWTEPLADLTDHRRRVVAAMKENASSASKLGSLLHTSAKITNTAQSYWREISDNAASRNGKLPAKPSIMTFDGAAYAGLNVRDAIASDGSRLQYLQDHLRIVDPLYGWLRPMDAIEPYRLEMASKGVFADNPKLKLEDYWKTEISSCLETEEESISSTAAAAGNHPKQPVVVVNLASDEYSAAVDRPMVKIVFRHGGRTIAVHAKRARGLMVRYATLNDIHNVDDLTRFDLEGYSYRADQSTYERGSVERTLLAPEAKDGEDGSKGTKRKKKKRGEPVTLVFDRPGTWKRS